ncbi:MAG: glycosyltransferase family 4 protein [Pseudomonadota bacterium]
MLPPVTHVLYLSEKPGRNPISGAESHVLTLVEELARAGADTELLVMLWNDGPLIRSRLAEAASSGVRIALVPRPTGGTIPAGRYVRALVAWWRLFRALSKRRARIIHLHLDLIATIVCARFAGCKHLVLSLHNDEQYFATARWHYWLRVIDRWIKAYIAITGHVKAHYLMQSGVREDKISVIHYGVPALREASLPREKLGIPRNRFVIGFVGRLTKQKNIPLLLKAMMELPEAFCIIIGDGEQRFELERLANSLNLDNVRFAGAIADARRYMNAFDVFCLPSIWEGLGLVLVEAMHQGVPIAASRAGAIPEVLDDGRCGILFDPYQPAALVEAIRVIQRDPGETLRMTARALRRASEMFEVTAMVSKTLAVYRRILCETGPVHASEN